MCGRQGCRSRSRHCCALLPIGRHSQSIQSAGLANFCRPKQWFSLGHAGCACAAPDLLPFLLSFLSFILFSPAGCTTPQLAGEQSACSWCTAAMCPAHLRISSYICSPSAPHHLSHRPASVCKLPQRLQAGRQHTCAVCRLTSSSACPCLLPVGQPAGVRTVVWRHSATVRPPGLQMGMQCPFRMPGLLTLCMLKILTG